MNENLGPEARQLINRARREEPVVDPDELARIRRSVLATATGAAALGSVGKALALQGAARFGVSSLIKAGLLGSGAGAMAFGVSLMLGSPSLPREQPPEHRALTADHAPRSAGQAVPEVASTNAQEEPVRNPAGVAPTEVPAGPRSALRPSAALKPVPSVGERTDLPAAGTGAGGSERKAASPVSESKSVALEGSTLAPELALLERVQSELRSGNGRRALELLDRSSIDVAHSQLGAERLAAEVFAACQAGDLERVRRASSRFLKEFPNSPSAARVRASCARAEGGE
ncbi:MAG TPA: hypothetical protein VG937_23800 [Polyangiaceae bacterium]|nr:hypothetical protein [Polyangiaceae bacterium]